MKIEYMTHQKSMGNNYLQKYQRLIKDLFLACDLLCKALVKKSIYLTC